MTLRVMASALWALTLLAVLHGELDLEWAAIGISVLAGLLWWRRVRLLRGARAVQDSQMLLSGDPRAGAESCQRILERYRGYGQLEAIALNNLSIAVFYQGDVAQAQAILDTVEKSGWCRGESPLRVSVLQNRVLYHAVVGNVREAEQLANKARGLISGPHAAASMLVHDAALAARAGKFGDVVALTGTREAIPRLQNKLVRVLRAWALVVTAPDSSRDEVRVLLDGARPVASGELRYAAIHWRELRTFLGDNGLAEAL